MKAVQIKSYGDPLTVLEIADIPEPNLPGPNEALLGIEVGPLNKHDLLFVNNALGAGPALPAVVGNEGLGGVLAVGRQVKNVRVGDRALAPAFSGAWREKIIVPASGLFPLPDGDAQQFSMLGSNPPTAALSLSEYIHLNTGDWVVQNAANSGVGHSLLAIARARGLRTINSVRRDEVVDELKAARGRCRAGRSVRRGKRGVAPCGQWIGSSGSRCNWRAGHEYFGSDSFSGRCTCNLRCRQWRTSGG